MSFPQILGAAGPLSAPPSVPANISIPTIAGSPQVGVLLTDSSDGTWSNTPTSFARQWNRAGTPIGGATGTTYTPVTADLGSVLSLTVIATNGSGSSAPATSANTTAVVDIIPTNVSLPLISGTPQVGNTLAATTGAWLHNPISYAYQWYRNVAGTSGTGTLDFSNPPNSGLIAAVVA